jgi:hypothetical protein
MPPPPAKPTRIADDASFGGMFDEDWGANAPVPVFTPAPASRSQVNPRGLPRLPARQIMHLLPHSAKSLRKLRAHRPSRRCRCSRAGRASVKVTALPLAAARAEVRSAAHKETRGAAGEED